MNNLNEELIQNRNSISLRMILKRLLIAFQFLTIIPYLKKEKHHFDNIVHSIIYFPFVGLFMGAVCMLLNIILRNYVSPFLKDIFVLGTLVALTGGLHLDGFVDIVDRLLGSIEKKSSTIINEKAISSFNFIYLIILLFGELLVFHNIPEIYKNSALLISPMLGRLSMVFGILLYESRKNTGSIGFKLIELINKKEFFTISAIPIILTLILIKFAGLFLIAILLFIAFSIIYYVIKKELFTAIDVFGAINEITEFFVFLFFMFLY